MGVAIPWTTTPEARVQYRAMGKKRGLWGFLRSLGRRGSSADDLAGFVTVELRPDPAEMELPRASGPVSQAPAGPPSTVQQPPSVGAVPPAEAALMEAVTHCVNVYIRPALEQLGADDSLIQHPTSRGQPAAGAGRARAAMIVNGREEWSLTLPV